MWLMLCELFTFFIPNIALFPCVHLFFNFLLFLLSQIVKLKTKKIKPFCFRARKILSFVDVAFGVSLPFLVCTCVCVSFCFNEKFDFSAVRGELRAIAVVFFSYPAKRSWNMEKKKPVPNIEEETKVFCFRLFLYALWNRSNCTTMAQSTKSRIPDQ